MSEEFIEVRQSKIYTILSCFGALLIISFLAGLAIFSLYNIVNGDYTNNEEQLYGNISVMCFSLMFILIITVMFVWLIYVYKKQIDIFDEEKLIRKRGKKIIFELPYSNIVEVREGYETLFMILKTHIIQANGKKGVRNLLSRYSRADISRIKRMITRKYYNIRFV